MECVRGAKLSVISALAGALLIATAAAQDRGAS